MNISAKRCASLKAWIVLSVALTALPAAAQVEIDRSVLETYSPPPMFGAPSPAPAPAAKKREPAPVPLKKPETAATKAPLIVRTDDHFPQSAPETAPAPAPASAGMARGPKTMPSAPAGDVERSVTFEPTEEPAQPMIERVSREEPPPPAPTLDPAQIATAQDIFRDAGKYIKKFTMPFPAGQTEITQAQKGVLAASTAALLQKNPGWRLQIQAFASPQDDSQSSDRRIALNRALAIRAALIDSGIEPKTIDVRAMGMQTDQQPVDRVDLYAFGPQAAP